MTDEQLEVLAKLTVANNDQIHALAAILSNVIEDSVESGRFDTRANILRSSVEQLAAASATSAVERENVRKFLGLD